MERCRICNEFKSGPYHVCDPIWYVEVLNVEDGPAEPEDRQLKTVCAGGAEEAAQKGVAKWDDGRLAREGNDIDAIVYDAEMKEIGRYCVTGDVQPYYYAIDRKQLRSQVVA